MLFRSRSHDKGLSWGEQSDLFDMGADQGALFAAGPRDYSGEPKLDFTDRNVLVASGSTPDFFCADGQAWIRVSVDGGYTWRPPIFAPKFGLPILSGHGSTLVRPDGVSLIFLTAVSADGVKRRPVVYASVDGGAFWAFVSFMTPALDDGAADGDRSVNFKFAAYRYFYPRGIMMPDGRIVASVRCQRDPTGVLWTEDFDSDDGGHGQAPSTPVAGKTEWAIQNKGPGRTGCHGPMSMNVNQASVLDFSTLRPR